MSGLYLAGGLTALIAFVLWLGFRAAKQSGNLAAQNDTLKAGAKTDAETQDILARPPADRDAIDKWLRGGGK